MKEASESFREQQGLEASKAEKISEYLEKADLVVLAETHHGTHFETLARIIDSCAGKLSGIFLELPVTYQASLETYVMTNQVDELLKRFMAGAQAEGKDISGLVLLLDAARRNSLEVMCIDSAKIPGGEYQSRSSYGSYFLRGSSRDEDMFENIQRAMHIKPGKYLAVAGAAHVEQGRHHATGDDTLGARLSRALSDKVVTILLGTSEAVLQENMHDYTAVIVEE